MVRLYLHKTDRIIKLPLEEYITGVVAAEMPAEFPLEALKAQAVAARTYILKRIKSGGVVNSQHPGADICDDYRHGQAWISQEEMKNRWGILNYYRYYYKIRYAVDSTRDQVITYKGQLIDPVYHSSCGGKGTEDAGEVWQINEPYLKGVPCPYCADPHPERVVKIDLKKVNQALRINVEAIPVLGTDKQMEVIEYTKAGRPKVIRIGDKTFPAVVLREFLSLRSTDFKLKIKEDVVEVTTRGYGHAVGMCQYGAKGMALQGYTYEQILKHYFTSVDIIKLEEK